MLASDLGQRAGGIATIENLVIRFTQKGAERGNSCGADHGIDLRHFFAKPLIVRRCTKEGQKWFYGRFCFELCERARRVQGGEKFQLATFLTLKIGICCHANQFGDVFRPEAECQVIRPFFCIRHLFSAIREQLADRRRVWLRTHVVLLLSSICSDGWVSRNNLCAAAATGSTPSWARQSRVVQPSGVPRLWPR